MQAKDAKEQLSNLGQKPTTGIAKILGYSMDTIAMVSMVTWILCLWYPWLHRYYVYGIHDYSIKIVVYHDVLSGVGTMSRRFI